MSDEKPFAYAIRNGCGKLRVGPMVVAAEYMDAAEATAAAIDAAVAAERRDAVAEALDSARFVVAFAPDHGGIVRVSVTVGSGDLRQSVSKAHGIGMACDPNVVFKHVDIEGIEVVRRDASAKALRDWANVREAKAKALPLGIAYHGGPLHDAPMYDVLMSEVRSLRARAAAVESGEA